VDRDGVEAAVPVVEPTGLHRGEAHPSLLCVASGSVGGSAAGEWSAMSGFLAGPR